MSAGQQHYETLRRCVVVGGAGAVGEMFVRLLEGVGAEVCVIDTAAPDGTDAARHVERGDITRPDRRLLDEVGQADLVLLTVPERVALVAIPSVLAGMKPGALFAETLSVKSRAAEVALAGTAEVEIVGLNPMFSPSLGMPGNPVAVVVSRDGPRTEELCRLLSAWGGRPVRMDADAHDRVTAAVQVLTHAAVLSFGLALSELDVSVDELAAVATPPHTMMLALLSRIVAGTPEVYWDVQSANPYASKARAALLSASRRLIDDVGSADESAFAQGLEQTRLLLGEHIDHYRRICAQTFASLRRPE